MRLTTIALIFCLISISGQVVGQSFISNSVVKDSLVKLSSVIWKGKTDSARIAANSAFYCALESALKSGDSDNGLFDSIPGITCVSSADRKIRIFTWNLPFQDGSNKYYGFIQLSDQNSAVIPLKSEETTFGDFSSQEFTPPNWYGALYYKLIEIKVGNQTMYTLLGWDGYTKESNRKIIDVLSVENNNIKFGLPVFKTDKGIKSRIIFEYSEKAGLLLRYDYQAIRVEKGKKIRKEENWMIVMDRLIPMDPSLKGISKFYVPAGDTYDGYLFRNGYWVLVEDIEVGNKQSKTNSISR